MAGGRAARAALRITPRDRPLTVISRRRPTELADEATEAPGRPVVGLAASPGATAARQGVPVIELVDVEARRGGRTIWSDVELSVAPGEFVALLGPNGAGKTTLLRVLLGLLEPSAGTVRVLGQRPGAKNSRIGYLPQRRTFGASTRVRGVDVVRLGLDGRRWGLPLPALGRFGRRERAAAERVDETIELVGAGSYALRPIGELSGGEQQRLLIAQALVRNPALLILDEPLDSLDLSNQAQIAALVQRVCRERGVAVVLVAHDINPLLPYLDRVIYLASGRALAGTPDEVISSERLSALYRTPVEVLRTSDGRMVVVGAPEAPFAHGPGHG
jgi:zinc/manganese transport system ATP-binding protein